SSLSRWPARPRPRSRPCACTRCRWRSSARTARCRSRRGIQQSLFPSGSPSIPGFELSAVSIPCYEVGGDHYDFMPLTGGRWALAVADVSGKGTPASLLMSGVHAVLRAVPGTARPGPLMARLTRFLCASTQAHRYVTLFYAELDPLQRRLT